jgi:hypothetical protein
MILEAIAPLTMAVCIRILDSDKVTDMVVGAIGNDDGCGSSGAVRVLILTEVPCLGAK